MIKWLKPRVFPNYIFLLSAIVIFYWIYTNLGNEARNDELPGWERYKSRNISRYVLPEQNTTVLEPHDFCKQKYFLVIAVCSHINNYGARQIIRHTWGKTDEFNYGLFAEIHSHLKGKYLAPLEERIKFYSEYLYSDGDYSNSVPATIPVRVVFVVGKMERLSSLTQNVTNWTIAYEAEQYNDIVQLDFLESYNNLTLKTVLALKWASQPCPSQKVFFMKIDDDVFVNMPNLLHFLLGGTIPIYADTLNLHNAETVKVLSQTNQLQGFSNLLIGYVYCNVPPITDISNKWYVPKYMYDGYIYPCYLAGSAFLMTKDVVVKLYQAALSTPYMHLEDVFTTGIAASKANISRKHSPLMVPYQYIENTCYLKGVLTHHRIDEAQRTDAYKFVINADKRCPPSHDISLLRPFV